MKLLIIFCFFYPIIATAQTKSQKQLSIKVNHQLKDSLKIGDTAIYTIILNYNKRKRKQNILKNNLPTGMVYIGQVAPANIPLSYDPALHRLTAAIPSVTGNQCVEFTYKAIVANDVACSGFRKRLTNTVSLRSNTTSLNIRENAIVVVNANNQPDTTCAKSNLNITFNQAIQSRLLAPRS